MKNWKNRLALALAAFASLLIFTVPLAAAAPDCSNPQTLTAKEQIQCGACDASGSSSCNPSAAPKSLNETIRSIVAVLSVIAGAVAVIMIIFGGFRYVTSAGNPEVAKSARNTILYALVGLVIIAMAQIIVHFVLNTTVNPSPTSGNPSSGSGSTTSCLPRDPNCVP